MFSDAALDRFEDLHQETGGDVDRLLLACRMDSVLAETFGGLDDYNATLRMAELCGELGRREHRIATQLQHVAGQRFGVEP